MYLVNHLAAVGLVYDIAGAVLLAWAILRGSAAQIRAQAGTFWGANFNLAKGLLEQQTDAFVGLPCLVLGFVLQLLAVVGGPAPHSPWWWLLAAALFCMIAIYLAWFRGWWIEKQLGIIKSLEARGEVSQDDAIIGSNEFN
jgi:drug/metabolite transporter (DMT)-like permease